MLLDQFLILLKDIPNSLGITSSTQFLVRDNLPPVIVPIFP